MSTNYKLDAAHNVVEEPDLMTWAKWFETADRKVRLDVIGDVTVSTVFLSLDHSFGDGPPVLFETMIFGGPHDQYQERYCTWDEAVAGHEMAFKLATSPASAGQTDPVESISGDES